MKAERMTTNMGHDYIRKENEWSYVNPLVEWFGDAGLNTGPVRIKRKEVIYELEQYYQLHENNSRRK